MSSDAARAPIPIEEVARFPRPGTAVPKSFAFSPDGQLFSYLVSPGGGLAQELHAMDEAGETQVLAAAPEPGRGEEGMSLEQRLRRERLRERGTGITSYQWARKGRHALVPYRDGLWVLDAPGKPLRELVPAGDLPAIGPRLSPDGEHVAFVRDAEVYVVPFAGGEPRQITHGARGTGRTHGLAEFVAQEEMHRLAGFWWSHDANLLAFAAVDETHIPQYRIVHQGKAEVGDGAQEDHRYPFAGCPNARVRLGVVPREGGECVWIELGDDEDIYLARVAWFHEGDLAVQILNREQSELRLLRCDPATGASTELLHETSDVWINLHRLFRPLRSGDEELDGAFVWGSEQTGFRHLELRDRKGRVIRPLTGGPWVVDELVGVDEERGLVYFTGNREHPTERHLYSVPLAGGAPNRVTEAAGSHFCVLDRRCERFAQFHHALDSPPAVTLRALPDGRALHAMEIAPDPRIEALALEPPELVEIENRDGVRLHGALYRPPTRDGEGSPAGGWPVLISVYGGPGPQRVRNAWDLTVDMRAQELRRLGFVVFVLDNRGSARRGLAFESAIRHDMGSVEVEDQVDGVRWLVEQGLGDPGRVGVYGWSYGGYMTLMCLARAPGVFHAGVSGAPVTSWDGYDTCYTERYMGTPQDNPEGYERSSVMHHVGSIDAAARLLLVHGLLDENVHFRHTARLLNALIRARKPHELMLFPDERHMPRREADRVYMEERIRDFLVEAVKNRTT